MRELLLIIGAVALIALPSVSTPNPPDCADGSFLAIDALNKIYKCVPPPTGSLPSGVIVLKESACDAGWSEVATLDSRMPLGTVAANGDVGQTGGNDILTPSGTINAQTFSGVPITSVINHTHTVNVTDPGHNHTQNAHTHTLPVGATDDTAAPFDRADAGTNASGANATTASGSTTPTNIAAPTGISAATINPAGGVASITPQGTISQAVFSGSAGENRSAFRRMIFCRKN